MVFEYILDKSSLDTIHWTIVHKNILENTSLPFRVLTDSNHKVRKESKYTARVYNTVAYASLHRDRTEEWISLCTAYDHSTERCSNQKFSSLYSCSLTSLG